MCSDTLLALFLLQPSQIRAFLCKDANLKAVSMSRQMSSHAPTDDVLMQDSSSLQSVLNASHESAALVLGSAHAQLVMTALYWLNFLQVEKAPLESYADVGGLEQQVIEIKEAVELPLTHPELYQDIGIKPPKVPVCSCIHCRLVC